MKWKSLKRIKKDWLDLAVYGVGTDFTEAGIIKYIVSLDKSASR